MFTIVKQNSSAPNSLENFQGSASRISDFIKKSPNAFGKVIIYFFFLPKYTLMINPNGSQKIFIAVLHNEQMSRDMTKTTTVTVRPAKTQISPGIRPV